MVHIWDKPFFVNLLLFGQYKILRKNYLEEFNQNHKVLQLGSTYWDICPSLAKHVKHLIVLDILNIQVDLLNDKFKKITLSSLEPICI